MYLKSRYKPSMILGFYYHYYFYFIFMSRFCEKDMMWFLTLFWIISHQTHIIFAILSLISKHPVQQVPSVISSMTTQFWCHLGLYHILLFAFSINYINCVLLFLFCFLYLCLGLFIIGDAIIIPGFGIYPNSVLKYGP